MRPTPLGAMSEWLEADGRGAYASGTVSGIRTRRYHALLMTATNPPTGRVALVNGVEAWLEVAGTRFPITSQHYTPGVTVPDHGIYIVAFSSDPWPRWTIRVADGLELEHAVLLAPDIPVVVLSWRLTAPHPDCRLFVRPLISGRDVHALHHENAAFRFDADVSGDRVLWRPYTSLPAVLARSNGRYRHDPVWYRQFLYVEEAARGLDAVEDLGAPGIFDWDLAAGEATLVFTAPRPSAEATTFRHSFGRWLPATRRAEEKRRAGFPSRLHRAAAAYIVQRGNGRSIIAGYPWFTDWGRDTCIALRGLCLTTGRVKEAREILGAWAGTISAGMLPNRFVEQSGAAEYTSVDASLWFVIAVDALLRAAATMRPAIPRKQRERLLDAVQAILTAYAQGTRYGIRLDGDGLLAAGAPGVALTWMDVKIGDWVVTPRTGKPVEVEALWLNALAIGAASDERWREPLERGRRAFADRFWNADHGCLYDVIDVDHKSGASDARVRPNQILAVGGLPLALLEGDRAARVVAIVEQQLLTPLGLRTLAPDDPDYHPRYAGDQKTRDAAYHQGTAWPWLLGPFVDAWLRVHGDTPATRAAVRHRVLDPLILHLDQAGLGHISEIADAEPPFTPRGCPFQAWSVGEALRIAAAVG
ncbi:MAG TPA: amylo-alpha-1,6-glucosidase [Gemmatimonadales bacterium]|nr:amylo-alpha-1,6-glucosidase [Gemmatimonadales bacterium]